MKTEKQITIDGRDYTFSMFGAGEGLELGLELTRLAAPVLAPLAAAGTEAEFTPEIADKVSKAIQDTLKPKEMVALVKRLMTQAFVAKGSEDGEMGGTCDKIFEVHFAGKMGLIVKVLREVIMHNFSDFFSSLGELATEAKTK